MWLSAGSVQVVWQAQHLQECSSLHKETTFSLYRNYDCSLRSLSKVPQKVCEGTSCLSDTLKVHRQQDAVHAEAACTGPIIPCSLLSTSMST